MKSILLSVVLVLLSIPLLFAQENKTTELSLQQCVKTAVEKNINVQIARIDQEKSVYKVDETRAALLPKINISGSFQDNLKLPTTLIPGEIFGEPGTSLALQMGAKYNTNVSISLNQVLYNQTASIALKLLKKSVALNTLDVEKAREEQAFEISKLYFLSLTTARQKQLLDENIMRTKHLSDIVKIRVDNGMSKQVDYERASINLENLYTQLSNTEATLEQQLNLIKYMLEIPLDEIILLTDTAEMPLLRVSPELLSDFSNRTGHSVCKTQKESTY